MNLSLPRLNAAEDRIRSAQANHDALADVEAVCDDLRFALETMAKWLQTGTPFTTKRSDVEALFVRWTGRPTEVAKVELPAEFARAIIASQEVPLDDDEPIDLVLTEMAERELAKARHPSSQSVTVPDVVPAEWAGEPF